MSTEKFNFENLQVYQRSVKFSNEIYNITKSWPKEYLFDLTSQIRRAVLSVPLNIAEGYGRTTKEYRRFLDISRASCFELIPLIEISEKQNLISKELKNQLLKEATELSKMLSGLKRALK